MGVWSPSIWTRSTASSTGPPTAWRTSRCRRWKCSHIQFYDGIRTDAIHETIIKSAADLISEETPNYQYLAARLAIFHLRKIAYGQFEPPHLYDHVRNLTEQGKYDAHLLADYSREEFDELNGYINHWRDMNFAYAAVKQMEGKYLIQNRVTKRIYESPQFLYLLVAMCLFAKYPAQTRLGYVKRFYDAVSRFKISLPTPIMAGVRTPMRQFSSCVLIECDDDLDSVNATTSAIVKYVSQRAGIGINGGRIRALGSEIRGGEALHTGCLPFFKMFQAAVKSCSQGGVRGGAATLFYPLWHLEVESLLVLKNNRGVEENRIRHLDYGVQVNRLLYQRLIKSQDITLFSPHDTPGLYEAFFADQDEFERLYLQYEQDPAIRKRSLPAVELFSLMMQERASTGRIYIQNVDHCNTHSPFDPQVAPVRQSNLCMEIALPTKALSDVNGGRRNRAVHAVGLQPGRAGNAGRTGRPGRPGRARARRAARLPGLPDPGGARRHEAPPAGRGRDQLRLLPGQARHALFRTGRAGPDAPHLRSHPVLPAEGLVAVGARVRPLLGFQRNHLQRRRAADRQLQEGRGRHLRRTAAPGLGSAARRHPRARPAQLHADGADALGNVSQIANATNGIEPPRGLVSVKQSRTASCARWCRNSSA